MSDVHDLAHAHDSMLRQGGHTGQDS